MISKRPQVRQQIKFSDCDSFGHLYNVRYLDYMFDAREQHVLSCYPALADATKSRDFNWVATHNEILYLQSAEWREEVLIESALVQLSLSGVLLEIAMLDVSGSTLKALLWSRLRYVDLHKKVSAKHPPYIQSFLGGVLLPIQSSGLRDRGLELSKSLACASTSVSTTELLMEEGSLSPSTPKASKIRRDTRE
jgi:acyl-CoA thioesterase FadM